MPDALVDAHDAHPPLGEAKSRPRCAIQSSPFRPWPVYGRSVQRCASRFRTFCSTSSATLACAPKKLVQPQAAGRGLLGSLRRLRRLYRPLDWAGARPSASRECGAASQ